MAFKYGASQLAVFRFGPTGKLYATDNAREQRVYIVMTRSDVATLLGAMRDAATGQIAIAPVKP
jgi:hypothetical protein